MKKLDNMAIIPKKDNADPEVKSAFLTFKVWEKAGKRRIYINDYKRRTLGYIDCNNGEINIDDKQGNTQAEIDYAIAKLKEEYEF